jgi:hypothetical protein
MATQSKLAICFSLMLGGLLAAACSKPSTAAGNEAGKATEPAAAQPTSAPATADRVVAYYLHGNRRCPTCLGIQEAIERTVRERFGAETAAGKLTFQAINIDEDANRAIVDQFKIAFSTLIVARIKDGKTLEWENCDRVWSFGHEPAALEAYTAERIRAYLGKLGAI